MRLRTMPLPNVLPDAHSETLDVSKNEFRLSQIGTGELPNERREVLLDALGNGIDDPPSFPLILDQVRVPEEPKLVGNAGLRHVQDERQLADAEVTLHEEKEDP